jgi:hypothetical protein
MGTCGGMIRNLTIRALRQKSASARIAPAMAAAMTVSRSQKAAGQTLG